jgi:hypothetical protein
MRAAMNDPTIDAAMARLDQAVDRLERSFGAREHAGAGLAADYALLDERHAQLRARVQETVARLDALIEAERG